MANGMGFSNMLGGLANAVGLNTAASNQNATATVSPPPNAHNLIYQGQQSALQPGIGQSLGTIPTLAQQFQNARAANDARSVVLEYIEAQLHMELFRSNTLAEIFFEQAMRAALESLKK
jgi:hypothetical protein